MMLISADVFLGTLQAYRLIWLNGRFGGGKTSLAFELAKTFLERGYRLITNASCVWADKLEDVTLNEQLKLKAVVVLDEGGLEFKSSRQVEMIAAYAAKLDVIYIVPSFFPPTRTMQVVTCQPIFNFKKVGVPLIVYRWRVKIGSFQDSGVFFWMFPDSIYGIYSRNSPGTEARAIVAHLVKQTSAFRAAYGVGSGEGEWNDELFEMETSAEFALKEAVSEFAGSVDELGFQALPKRGGRR